jgi:hypothetical protein
VTWNAVSSHCTDGGSRPYHAGGWSAVLRTVHASAKALAMTMTKMRSGFCLAGAIGWSLIDTPCKEVTVSIMTLMAVGFGLECDMVRTVAI